MKSADEGLVNIESLGPMPAETVVTLLQLFERHGLEVHVDGGWGVDALLERQTRGHGDLDIALPHAQVPQLRRLLAAKGYVDVPRDDSWACNFVLGDGHGHEVDVHSYELDATGQNAFGVAYRAAHLTGVGRIADYPVRCIDPQWMVWFHTGYPVDEDDYHDVKLLCDRYGFPLPDDYRRFDRG